MTRMTRIERLRALWAARPRWWPAAAGAAALALVALLTVRAPDGIAAPSAPAADTRALSAAQKAAVEATVREYILAHPEIIPEAITALQSRSVSQLLASNRAAIETPFAGASTGARDGRDGRDGDVTLVEFFDFACPYCRAAKANVDALIASDPRLRVVWRDFPVISPNSEEPALAALSAARQGRYRAFYDAMFADPARVSHEKVVAAVRTARLNEVATARALGAKTDRDELKKNIELGRALGLTGTPAFIVGDKILMGAQSLDDLKAAVAEARAKRG